MKGIMTQARSPDYVHLVITCNRREHFVLRRCSWKKKNAQSLPSGAICPCQPKKTSTDYKPAEYIHNDTKCILKFCLFNRGNSYLECKTNDWCGARSATMLVHESLLATVKRAKENLHGSSMSHAPWIVGNAVVGRENAGWTTSKSGHSCPCQNCSQGSHAEKTGIGFLLNRPLCPPDDPFDQGTEINWNAFRIFEFSVGWKW